MATEYHIYGPPGTGKTTTIQRQLANVARTYAPEQIMVASFTRAAAAELNSRNLPIPEQNVGTLHAMCYRLLGMPPIAETRKGIREFNEWARDFELSGAAVQGDLDEPEYKANTDADAFLQAYAIHRAKLLPRTERIVAHTANGIKSANKFAEKWEAFKYESGYVDFTDLIEICLRERIGPPAGVRVGFFDEVQDFTPLELALIRMWSESLDYITLVGDDDQCIYGFKGATPDAFLQADLPAENKRYLEQGYRLPASIHLASQLWISRIQGVREDKYVRPRNDVFGEVETAPMRYGDMPSIERMINRVMDYDGNVMFLASCSYMLYPIVKALRTEGIPFHNPYRRKRGDWNPLRGTQSVSTVSRIEALLRRPWTFHDARLFSPLVKATGNFKRGALTDYLPKPPGEQVLDDTAIQALFTDAGYEGAVSDPIGWLQRNAQKAKQNQIDFIAHVINKSGVEALASTPKVIVGTIHSVKGGEADTVVLLPDISKRAYINGKGARSDDTIRQFYVGMTRARERLIIGKATLPPMGVVLPTSWE